MDCDKFIEKDIVMKLLFDSNSRFVPENRIYMFMEGIYAGFCNNYILAAHILIPQIENSFKFVLEQNDKFTTRYAEDKQSDNTLGAFLNSDKGEGMLKDICSQNLFEELSDFLINSKSTNFRNELCHGLMEPFLIEHYGKYLWWLSLKMIIQTDNYFIFPKEE
ncbi:DUF4209 domain-containing protein [Flavobacterium hibisci]|uniref:DUF4209 domain-containing protein n=1 Tax=Flavobacterium hibisci TaxID=1914462 RepID=UPI001CC05032|nr:DUF4209 domain-containing protein [Flavobacterium hibisci]MBZ4042284.1 DUF4209 domain-containing protein [Flavobacterium hibisci]